MSVTNEDGTAQDSELVYRNVGLAHICEEENDFGKLLKKLKLTRENFKQNKVDPAFLEEIRRGMPPGVGFCMGVDRMLWKLKEGKNG